MSLASLDADNETTVPRLLATLCILAVNGGLFFATLATFSERFVRHETPAHGHA